MARTPKDPDLNKLAHELQEIGFAPSHEFVERSPSDDLRRVFAMPNQKTWAVRLFLGGENRCIGYTEDLTAACRYADMAAWRFWKYRTRGACPPVDAELNFGVEHTKQDCANELQANHLLDKIEQYLRHKGSLPDYKEVEADRDASRRRRDERRTVRNDMIMLFDDVMTALSVIDERLKLIELAVAGKQINPAWVTASHELVPQLSEAGVELFKRDRIDVDIDTMTDFIVNVPLPNETKKVLIQVPTRRVSGLDVIQPEGLELIERTKREYIATYEAVMKQRQELIDIFSPPTSTTQTQPVYES